MKLKYLGTAAAEGWPAVFCACEACKRARSLGGKDIRTRSQALVDDEVLLDLPPDTYLHALREEMALDAISALFITHSHCDHFYPMELLMRGEPYAHRPKSPRLTVYGNEKADLLYRLALKSSDSPNLSSRLEFKRVRPFEPISLASGHLVTPLKANHAPEENCLVYLVEKGEKRLFYGHDAGSFPEETWEYLKGRRLNLVSLDCTNMEASEGTYHMGLFDNRETKARMRLVGCAGEETEFIISHFSHNGGLMHQEIAVRGKRDGFIAAYDGLEVEF